MADAWAGAWGDSWGDSWGSSSSPTNVDNGVPITNANATTDVPVNYIICDRTGFKVTVKESLVEDGYGLMVRIDSYDPRHPQDMIGGQRAESLKGSVRPEQPDNFIDSISDPSEL